MLEFQGILKEKKDTRQVSDSFRVREFVITDNSNAEYPQHVLMQVTQDRCDLLDSYKIGDSLKVNFNLKGRAWTNPEGEIRYFNSVEVWKIEKLGDVVASEAPSITPEEDDLPF